MKYEFSIFNFFLNPPVASQLSPLQREANPPQATNSQYKNRKEKEFHEWVIVPHTEIATGFSSPRNDGVGVLSLRGVKRRSNPQSLITNTKTEKKKIPWMNNCIPYWDCHGFFKASQWRCWGTVIASEAKQSINHKNHHQKQKRKRIYYYLSN